MLKKIITAILLSVSLVGCGAMNVSDKDTVVFRIGDKNVTKGDVYRQMKWSGGEVIVNDVMKEIYEKEIGRPKEVEDFVSDTLESYHANHEEEFKENLEEAGLTEEEYSEQVLVPYIQNELLLEKYINENVAELSKKYSPRKVTVLNYSSEAAAKEALESNNLPSTSSELFTTESTNVSQTALDAFLSAKKGEWSTVVNEEAKEYFVFRVEEDDVEEFKDEVVEFLLNTDGIADAVSEELVVYYLKKYEFKSFDEDVTDAVKGVYPELIK